MTHEKTYKPEDLRDAKQMAEVLASTRGETRSLLSLALESMIIGIDIGEKSRAASGNAT